MITIERIQTKDIEKYEFVEKLLIEAFPQQERRELKLQRDFTDHNPLFFNNIILNDGEPVGFITYWDFDTFCYIEHFAISSSARNGGFGKKVLEAVDELLCRNMVLEVELPTEEMSQRRIGFYQRLGYTLWEKAYQQPPYREGDSFLPMFLMVKGNLDLKKDFDFIKSKLYKEVYLQKDIC